jgi:hypothetical protein
MVIQEAISESEFWESEEAIVRAQVLQNPTIMAAMLENLEQRVKEIEALMREDKWPTPSE